MNLDMRRSFLATAGALALCGLIPASADATITELGATTTPLIAPACPKGLAPSDCKIILNRVTALETIRDTTAYPSTVKQAGRLVAFTVGVSALSTNPTTVQSDLKFLDSSFGGDAQVGITVLKRVGKKAQWSWQVVAQSPLVDVQPFLGQVVQFPLTTTIPVGAGALDRPLHKPLRLPPESEPQLPESSLQHAGSGQRLLEHVVLVRLPGDAGRVQRNRGHESGGADHIDDQATAEEVN